MNEFDIDSNPNLPRTPQPLNKSTDTSEIFRQESNPKAFELTPLGGGMGPKTPEPPKTPGIGPENQTGMPPELRERYERSGALPVEGMDILENLQSVEIGENADISELRQAIDDALAFREGLEFGPDGYAYEFDPHETSSDQHDKQKIGYLQKMFVTVEGASDRPNPAYLDIAIKEAVNGRIRRAQDWHKNPQKHLIRFASEYTKLNKALIRSGQKPLGEEEVQSEIEKRGGELENEYQAIPALVELSNYVNARETFDFAFRHRMQTCEDPKAAASLGNDTKTVTPDGPVWMAYFQGKETGDFGIEVNTMLEEIVKFGLPEKVVNRLGMESIPDGVRKLVPESIYVDGFSSGVIFGTWMNHLLEKANGKMDIVWNAWKMALTTEVIDTLGEKIDMSIDKKTGEPKKTYVLATPPLGNALFTFINHLSQKRAIEFGLKADGTRSQTERYVSHSGLPMSLGMRPYLDEKGKPTGKEVPIIPDLCSDYLHESKIKFNIEGLRTNGETFAKLLQNIPNINDPDFNPSYAKLRKDLQEFKDGKKDPNDEIEISLWDIWLYGRISLADPKFPWFQTDQPDADAIPNELPPGNMGSWFLTRGRANGIVEDLKSQPSLGELGDPLFFVKRVRNWAKVLGKTKEDSLPEENPRNWWIMGIITLHLVHNSKIPVVNNETQRDFRLSNSKELIERREAGSTDTKSVSTGDVLENAVRCGFIREKDRVWIKKNLAL